MADFNIITIDSNNIDDCGFFCVKDTKHPGYITKREWLQRRFKEGLKIKLIMTEKGKQAGFIEYIPGEYTWRVVHAPEYLVIHCIWVESKKYSIKGMASALLRACLEEAKTGGYKGLAVVSSDGTWMADKSVFLKNGFIRVDETPPHYQLLIHRLEPENVPSFPVNWEERLKRFKGLKLIYTHQCPYIGKTLTEFVQLANMHGLKLDLVEVHSASEARDIMPSPYGVICLVYNGRLLVDHPISKTRFKNILQKELNLHLI
ncbi:MAG: hypothetical protein JSW33_07090 [bacterium]|nr:MAG: hypothetical protein JSW33_07090 [bacterium]